MTRSTMTAVPATPATRTSAPLTLDDARVDLRDGRRLTWSGVLSGGECWVLLGANGAGKSTWLRTLAGLQRPDAGQVTYAGRPIHRLPRRLRARAIGLLPQAPEFDPHASVLETAVQGRYPHRSPFTLEGPDDYALAAEGLAAVELDALATRRVGTLSGGERQRLALATLLVQDPCVWLLDEPTNHLDWHQQSRVLRLIDAHRRRGGLIVAALHDVNLAAAIATHALLLFSDGQSCAGPVDRQLVPDALERLYGEPVDVFERAGRRVVLPRRDRPDGPRD